MEIKRGYLSVKRRPANLKAGPEVSCRENQQVTFPEVGQALVLAEWFKSKSVVSAGSGLTVSVLETIAFLPGLYGRERGIDVFYSRNSPKNTRFALRDEWKTVESALTRQEVLGLWILAGVAFIYII